MQPAFFSQKQVNSEMEEVGNYETMYGAWNFCDDQNKTKDLQMLHL